MIPYKDEYIKYCLNMADVIMNIHKFMDDKYPIDISLVLYDLFNNPSKFSVYDADVISLVDRFGKAYVFLLTKVENLKVIDIEVLDYNSFVTKTRSDRLDIIL